MRINQGTQATLEASRRALSSAELRLLRTKAARLKATARRASRRFPLISAGIVGVLWLATMLASDAPWPVITGFWAVAWLGLTIWGMKDLWTSGGYMTSMAAGLESALRRKEADVFVIRSRSYVEFEEIEDEGACYAFELDDERLVFISGQEFYPEAKFPSLDFSLVYVLDEKGQTVDMLIEKRGPRVAPSRVISAEAKERLDIPEHLATLPSPTTDLENRLGSR